MFAALQHQAGGVNLVFHHREPASLDDQPVIRQNRDTLYSSAIVDITDGATVTVPDGAGRYLSVMVVNEDHYINRILHEPGDYELTTADFDTDYIAVAARILVDPNNPADVSTVNQLQDQLAINARSARPFVSPDFDKASLDTTRDALLTLSRGLSRYDHSFGRRDDVDPVRHLIATAAGWAVCPSTRRSISTSTPAFP